MTKKELDEKIGLISQVLSLDSIEYVNKDYWLIEALKSAISVDTCGCQLVFGGGTCLTRAYGITQRMSEDIDLRVANFPPQKNRQEIGKKGYARAIAHNIRNKMNDVFGKDNVKYKTKLKHLWNIYGIDYPVKDRTPALKPFLKIELTRFDSLFGKNEVVGVRSLLTEYDESKNGELDISSVWCVSPLEILLDKMVGFPKRMSLTIANWEKNEKWVTKTPEDEREKSERIIKSKREIRDLLRHLYDIYKLCNNDRVKNLNSLVTKDTFDKAVRFEIKQDLAIKRKGYEGWHADPQGTTVAVLEELKQVRYEQLFNLYARNMIYDKSLKNYQTMLSFVGGKIIDSF